MPEELVGVIGGTGLADVLAAKLEHVEQREVQTPFGAPSGPIVVGTLGHRRVAFINRHGPGHRYGPSDVPFAANIFALKQLGARAVIASGAVGSLREEIAPGDLVVVDQFIDKTFRRTGTFFGGYGAVHCEMADPTCSRLRATLLDVAGPTGVRIHPQGTYVCMEGPQFSTLAESQLYRSWGMDVVGMTNLQEAKLAREAEICYTTIAHVTDYDCWHPEADHVTVDMIVANLQRNVQVAQQLIAEAVERVPSERDCPCGSALATAIITSPDAISEQTKRDLAPLISKYVG